MGQKTHPKGLRLEVNKNWTSNWFPKKNAYATDLAQDIKLRKYLKKRLQDASVASIVIERTSQAITVTIYTARPGIVIGRGGEEVSRLKKEVAKLCNTEDIHLNINEVKRPELNAELVGQNIASQLVKKMPYRRVLNKTMQSTMRMGAEGIRINVSGRLGGVEIARSERFMEGRVPLHTLRADIDYALVEAHTTYGIIGIKVWICNGFSKAKK
ncbi:MAG: 30S ribosomal protein S3 [Candidatus Marinimicrobia bacterium]|jgi:small subunit ribosomal protein S3|nr:30S ribosomal protein S3 [Candidatus Neomarinimicrobiota bacterium]|tara:strand:- start:4557 stop:5195 length:639 start_codon:yes stop_codon:yes gene_type:complete